MAIYNFLDNETGREIEVDWHDAKPPTEEDVSQIFEENQPTPQDVVPKQPAPQQVSQPELQLLKTSERDILGAGVTPVPTALPELNWIKPEPIAPQPPDLSKLSWDSPKQPSLPAKPPVQPVGVNLEPLESPTIGYNKPTDEVSPLQQYEEKQSWNMREGLREAFEIPDERGYELVKRIGKDWGAGAAGLTKGFGGLQKAIGLETSGKFWSEYGKGMEEYYKVKDPKFLDHLVSGSASMAMFFIPGIGIARGTQALMQVPKIATMLGVLASSLTEAALQSGSDYETVYEKTKDHKQAQKAAAKSFALNMPVLMATNRMGELFDLRAGKSALGKAALSSQMEGMQEAAQELISAYSTGEPTSGKNIAQAYGAGALLGGTFAGGSQALANKEAQTTKSAVDKLMAGEKLAKDEVEALKEVLGRIYGKQETEAKGEPVVDVEGKQKGVVIPTPEGYRAEAPQIPEISTIDEKQAEVPEIKETPLESKPAKPEAIVEPTAKPAVDGGGIAQQGEVSNTDELIRQANENIAQELPSKVPPIGLSTEETRLPLAPKETKNEFANKEAEQAYQQNYGVKREGRLGRIANWIKGVGQSAVRTHAELPMDMEHAKIHEILDYVRNAKPVAKENTARIIQNITLKLNDSDFDLFNRKVVLDDYNYDASQGKRLTKGFTPEIVKQELAIVNEKIKGNKSIEEALAKRKQAQAIIVKDLVDYGILTEEQTKNPDYFHHQVLMYANIQGLYNAGKKLRKPKPGLSKKRGGTELAVNNDYLQAEYEYMSQALHDIRIAKAIKMVENSHYNIKSEVIKEAESRGVKDWRTILPEGYSIWQPKEGNVFFTHKAIPEILFDKILEEIGENSGIDLNVYKKDFLSVGKKRLEMVLPENVANTLDNMYKNKNPNWVSNLFKDTTTAWKVYILFNPARLLKYNYQNTLGDLDAVFAGNIGALTKVFQATRELYDHFYNDKPMTKDMYDFFETGGLSSGLTITELPDLMESSLFKNIYKKKKFSLSDFNLFEKWFQSAGKISTFRENILRYSAYLKYLEYYKSGKFPSYVLKYGTSDPNIIDSLSTPEAKAAKVSTELLGDYANVSLLMQGLSDTLMPFGRWFDINFKRYPKMFMNAMYEGKTRGTRVRMGAIGALTNTARASANLASWGIRASALWAVFQAWNNSMFPDIEETLSEFDKRRMHINLGWTSDGKTLMLRGQGALSDFFEWWGLNEYPRLAKLLAEDKINLGYMAMEMAKSPVNKLLQGINPIPKAILEYLAGISLFPDVINPRVVIDKNRKLFQNFQLEDLYDYLMGNPQKSLADIMLKFTPLVKTDPLENAYNDVMGAVRTWQEQVGDKGYRVVTYDPKSVALYKYRLAIRYNDKKAIQRFSSILKELGVTEKKKSKILSNMEPLSILSSKEKSEFLKWYSTYENRATLGRAKEFYKQLKENKRSKYR